jgi:hypothetical protein
METSHLLTPTQRDSFRERRIITTSVPIVAGGNFPRCKHLLPQFGHRSQQVRYHLIPLRIVGLPDEDSYEAVFAVQNK